MKCHYEVLDISREADDNEIKTAYRKLALKWHPDKNLQNTELAKEQFQLVQQAYEVLSDRQERAWYDKHREQILRGADSDYKDNNLDVFQYFTTTCFKGHGDDEKGFYCTYRKVFEQLAKEDCDHMENEEEMHNIPKFGDSNSSYEEVVGPFYDYWMSYSTKKSYVWLDAHNIKEASNRKVFKLIEKENDKIRQKARRERNEEVRNLVAFVRKRDKRVQTHVQQLERKKVENREKQKKITNQKRRERIKQLNESSEQAAWMKFENVKTELEEIERKLAAEFGDDASDSDDSSDLDELNNLYCVACNKIFKTPKAFQNHESSRKHKENVEILRRAVIAENSFFNDVHRSSDSNNSVENDPDTGGNDSLNGIESKTKKKNKKGKNIIKIVEDDENVSDIEENSLLPSAENGSEGELKPLKKQKGKKKKDRTKKEGIVQADISEVADTTNTIESEMDKDLCCAKCQAKFCSKNKLFEHLKKTGHSCHISTANTERNRRRAPKRK